MYTIRNQCKAKAQSVIGKDEYWLIYKNITDSIRIWNQNKLGQYKSYNDTELSFSVDSILCVNREGNKLRTGVLLRCLYSDCVQDDIVYYNGIKINNRWYFFSAGSLVLIRKCYQRDIHKPLSWELMEQIAADHLYSSYLKSDDSINDHFFNELTSVAWGPATNTQAQWDSTYLAIIRSNWEKKE